MFFGAVKFQVSATDQLIGEGRFPLTKDLAPVSPGGSMVLLSLCMEVG